MSVGRDLGALAITDDNIVTRAQTMPRIAPFSVVIGGEISTSDGEIVGLLRERLHEAPIVGTRSPFWAHFRSISAEAFGNLHKG
jgi:predicted metal-dependent phosphoesterase TrpH